MRGKRYYTVTEAAQLLGVTRQAIHKRIKRGVLPHFKAGHQYLIPVEAFNYITKKSSLGKRELVDKAVIKTVKEYAETLKLMAAEEHEDNNTR